MIRKNLEDRFYMGIYGALAFVLALYYVTMLYGDICITHQNGLDFLDCLFSGNLKGFYTYTAENPASLWVAVYYLPLYIIFGIWDLPVWVLIKLNVITGGGRVALLWAKLLVVVSVMACAYFLGKLASKMERVKTEDSVFLFLSSMMAILPTFAVAQYDSISLAITLWGICRYVEEDKMSFKTLLIFSLAISLKLFALFPFIFLVLLKEKRVLHIVKEVLAGLLVSAISVLPYRNDPGYQFAVSSFNGKMTERLLIHTFPGVAAGNISLFVAGLAAVYIIAFYISPKNKQHLLKTCAWLGTLFYLVLFSFFEGSHPYWYVLIVPFIVLLISENGKNLKINWLLETVLELAIIYSHSVNCYWIYFASDAFDKLVLQGFYAVSDVFQLDHFAHLTDKLGISIFVPATNALFITTGVALLVLNHPWKATEKIEVQEDILEFKRGLLLFRLICVTAYFVLALLIRYVI